jgi:hypothetical protein
MKQPADLSPNVYLIVGMHRSGTSSIGRLMEAVGFDFGDNLLEGVDSINDRGFWEDREVVALDEHIFSLYGTRWYDFERLPGKWWEEEKIKDLIGVAETWYREGFSHDKPVAVKDPRFCRLLPFWKRVFLGMGMRPHIIFVMRHPAEVAASLKRRDGFSLQVGYLLWLAYVIDGLYYSRNLDLALVDYETLLSNPEKTVARLMKDDISSLHGLSQAAMVDLVRKTLDIDSRHQKVGEVLSTGEVQGDVQALAHELYDELVAATSEQAKSLADKYRKRFYRLLDHHREVLSALQSTVNKQVETNQKLTEVGSGHTYALSVIHDKDRQLEENKDFIAKCLAEIDNKESQLALTQQELEQQQACIHEQQFLDHKHEQLWEHFEKLQQTVQGRELKLSESLAYIEKCEAWIGELNLISEDYQRLLVEQREYSVQSEARLVERDSLLVENTTYIGKCEARIKEQDDWLAENKSYIERCEARIREQDNGLHIRDQMLGERLDRIQRQETKITELEQSLSSREQECGVAKASASQLKAELGQYTDTTQKLLMEKQQILERQSERITGLERLLSDQERQCVDAKASAVQLKAELERYTDVTQTQLTEKQQILDEKLAYLRQCEIHMADQARVLEALEQTLTEREVMLARNQQEAQRSRDQTTQLENDLKTVRYQQSGYEQQIAMQDDTVTTLKRHIARQSDRQLRLDAELATTQQQLQAVDIANSQTGKQLQGAQADIKGLKQELQVLHASHVDVSRQLHVVQQENKELGKAGDSLRGELGRRDEIIGQLQQEVQRVQKMDEMARQIGNLQKRDIDQLKTHVAVLESEAIALKAQLEVRQKELERYRSYRVVRLLDKFSEVE